MPNRIIREGILTSEKVNSLSPEAEVFYHRLMSIVDDFGRTEAHPTVLLAKCYPLQLDRVCEQHVRRVLAECAQDQPDGVPLITLYASAKKEYLQINNFGQRERTPKHPGPHDADIVRTSCGHLAARATNPNTTPTTTANCSFPEESHERNQPPAMTPEVMPSSSTLTVIEPVVVDQTLSRWTELRETYRLAGKLWADRQEQVLLQRFIDLSEAQQEKLIDYVQRRLVDGTWPDPQHTKSLQNLLHDGDWATPEQQRILPQVRAPTRRENEHAAAAEAFINGRRG